MVSVVIPTCNRRCFLQEAVQSVISQSLSRFELIIADDGSTDATEEYGMALAAGKANTRYLLLEHSACPAGCAMQALASLNVGTLPS